MPSFHTVTDSKVRGCRGARKLRGKSLSPTQQTQRQSDSLRRMPRHAPR